MKSFISFIFCFSFLSSRGFSDVAEKKAAGCKGECWITQYLDPVPDFPSKGVLFQWYRPLLSSPSAFSKVIQKFAVRYKDRGVQGVVALDARGFVFGSALAYEMKVPLTLIRKGGKLPGPVYSTEYKLEYGSDKFELEVKSLAKGQKVVLIDDVIATGGTMIAAAELVRLAGAEVIEACAVMDLPPLKGKESLLKENIKMFSLVSLDVK